MTLHDLLDDLARAEPVGAPVLAEMAWSGGRRRRVRTRARAVVAAVAGLALLALLVPGLPAELPVPRVAGTSGGDRVEGYPERIGHQWWVRDLPERPGPVAALMQTVVDKGSYDAPGDWYAVRSDGHRWRLPFDDETASLSRDGRLLGYVESFRGPYVVQNLVTGERQEVAASLEQDNGGSLWPAQSPAHFSPDGRWLLLPGDGLLEVATGVVRRLPQRPGLPAGWAANDRIVWLRGDNSREDEAPAEVRAITTDLTGRVVADVPLRGTIGLQVNQWSGAVHSDGGLLAVLTDEFGGEGGRVRRFFLQSGESLEPTVEAPLRSVCGGAWGTDGRLVVPTYAEEAGAVAQEVTATSTRDLTVVAPRVGADCLVWAGDALAGPGRGGGLLGTDTTPLAWWWKELLLAVLAVLGLPYAWRRLHRRRSG